MREKISHNDAVTVAIGRDSARSLRSDQAGGKGSEWTLVSESSG